MNRNTITCADSLDYAKSLPDNSVHCIVTSPPYYGLRDYGIGGQMGLEDTPQAYLARLIELFHEYRRVLRKDGTFWLNMGDSYANDTKWGGRSGNKNYTSAAGGYEGQRQKRKTGFKPKDLMMMPARLAIALCDDGWWLRQEIVWAKKNCMPESVRDRPTRSHEMIYLLTKSPKYFFDQEAVREKASETSIARIPQPNFANQTGGPKDYGLTDVNSSRSSRRALENFAMNPGSNLRSVWSIATEPTPFAHFATFPQKLVERCILAGCPHKTCARCGAPWVREVERGITDHSGDTDSTYPEGSAAKRLAKLRQSARANGGEYVNGTRTLDWTPTCTCHADTVPGVVLDPFMGSGTVPLVARRLGREYLGCDLNPEYVKLANSRLDAPYTLPMVEVLQA